MFGRESYSGATPSTPRQNSVSNRAASFHHRLSGLEPLEDRRILDCHGLVGADACIPGDADLDGVFSQSDIVQVLQAGKYLTGQPTVWQEGDWTGDGVFNGMDIVSALQAGAYQPKQFADSSERLSIDNYGDCGELHTDFQSLQERYSENQLKHLRFFGAFDFAVADDAPSTSSFTNVQESGVDEADYVKIGQHHIFVAREDRIEVVDRHSLNQLGRISLSPEPTEPSRHDWFGPGIRHGQHQTTMYTDHDRLVLIETFPNEAKVRIFADSQDKLPEMIAEQTFTGSYVDSRFVDGRLIMVLNDRPRFTVQPQSNDQWYPLPIVGEPARFSQVPCDRIVKPPVEDADPRLTKVVAYNTRDVTEEPAMAATVGSGDQIYMTEDNLYITKYVSANLWSFDRQAADGEDTLIVTKVEISVEDTDVKVAAIGSVRGAVKDQWAFREYDEHDDALSIATTTYSAWNSTSAKTNHLWVLQQNGSQLETVAAINDYGRTEDIRSVRYVGDMAYVVTFKKTDPLFAFDMSEPTNPKQLGELKIPGFSTYMHPVAPGQLVGVGFDAFDQGRFALYQGIQVSLFDVQDPRQMKRTDNIVIGGRGSNSEATANHHAFYFDSSRMMVGIPIVELQENDPENRRIQESVVFTGAILFGIEGDQLEERYRLSHESWIPQSCRRQDGGAWWQNEVRSQDIDRIFQVDDQLMTVSRWGIKAHDLDDPSTVTNQTRFQYSSDAVCDA